MAAASAFASLPAPLTNAYKKLCKELKTGIDQPRHMEHLSNKDEICESVWRFVGEFRNVPTWHKELAQRAYLIGRMCGEKSKFARAATAAWGTYRRSRKSQLGPNLSGVKLALQELRCVQERPLSLVQVVFMRKALVPVIEAHVLEPRAQAAFQQWLQQCREVESRSARMQVDGCNWLYGVYKDMAAGMQRSGKSACMRAALEGMLEEMLAAAKSLMAWATQHPPKRKAPPGSEGNDEAQAPRGGRKKLVNARMMETIQANVEAMGWNSPQWAKYLDCSKSSVVGTKIWKDLAMGRERVRAERARDRRRRPKASDQKRD